MKTKLFNGALALIALAGIVYAGGPDFGRGLWFQHPVLFPAAETIGAGGTITANACGGIKRITSTAARTTDTTNTFTAPSALNAGCLMQVNNVGPYTITLDANALFPWQNDTNVVLQSSGSVTVWSDGAIWRHQAPWTNY